MTAPGTSEAAESLPGRLPASLPAPLLPPLWSVLSLWRAQAGRLGIGVAVSLLALSCGLALLGVSGLRLAGASIGLLLVSAWSLRLLGAGRVLLRYLERLLTHGATFRALADLRVWFFRRLAGSAAGGLGLRHTGDALSRLVGDVEALDGLYLRLLLPLCAALLILPGLALLLGRLDPGLAALVCALFALAALLLPWRAARRSSAAGARLAGAASGLRVAALDLVSGLREIRAFDAGGPALARVQGREAELIEAQAALVRHGAAAGACAFLCGQAAILLLLAASLGLGFRHLGAMASVLCLFLLLAAFDAVSGLVRAGVLAGHMSHAARRVLEAGGAASGHVAAATDGAATDGAATDGAATDQVAVPDGIALRFEGVRFRWQPDRAAVFDALSLEIPAGSRVALLGASGSGKSTLASLLLRVATPQAGRVTLGGVDIARISERAVRGHLSWVGQDSHLFDDSIRNNLLLGRPDADEPALWAALEQAQIADLVRGLPDGLECWLGESATRVSGGQARRLALARALLSEAPILILDEPCAGLDADTERQFLLTLNEVAAGRSVILITHRLMGVERLDRIWRLQDGRAVAAA